MYEAENGIFQEAKGEMKSIGETQVKILNFIECFLFTKKTVGSLKYEFSNVGMSSKNSISSFN